jgi:hypothetical protein
MRGFAVARGGVEPPTFRFSVGRSYQLSYLAGRFRRTGTGTGATPTGLEPATSAVTGRRANQLRYGALRCREAVVLRGPGTAIVLSNPMGWL